MTRAVRPRRTRSTNPGSSRAAASSPRGRTAPRGTEGASSARPKPTARLSRTLKPSEVRSVIARHMLADGFDLVPDLERSRGSRLRDARDGRKYLDFFNFYATAPIGHNHPRLLRPDVRRRLLRASVSKPSNSDFYTLDMAQFVDTFFRVAAPPSLPHLFLVDGGTLAVENALKVAFDWKVRKNFARGSRVERGHQVLHFREAFHGRSGYALSMTNTYEVRKTQYYPKFDWPRVSNPKILYPVDRSNQRRVEEAEVAALDEIRRAIARRGDDIAALIIEPIQGEGGDNHFRGDFLRALRKVCDENEIFFILDEVQTGLGTTGKMWAYQHFGFEPDALAFGKKTQVCGILVGRRVDEVPDNVFVVSSRINSTWGGNLVDMVRATTILEVIESEDLVRNAADTGRVLVQALEEMAKLFPGRVTNVRGRGVFAAFDLPSTEERNAVHAAAFREGIVVLRSGERSIRCRPALTLTAKEAVEGAERITAALKRARSAKEG